MKTGDFSDRLLQFVAMAMTGERAELAKAMRAELQELNAGRLSWALGCAATVVWWRGSADWAFLAGFFLIAFLGHNLVFLPLMYLPSLAHHPFSQVSYEMTHVWFLVGPAILCGVLGAVRPRYWRLVGVTVPIVSHTYGLLTLFAMNVAHGLPLSGRWVVDDAPITVGIVANVGACLCGAWIGSVLQRARS